LYGKLQAYSKMDLIHDLCFSLRRTFKCLDIQIPCAGKGQILFCKNHSDYTKKFAETDIINMLEFLIDNIFVMFGGRVFQ
jgi:hypothetical protein